MMREGFSTAIRRHRPALLALGLFGFAINILMLTGPLFMLQGYDRVLTSRSEPTLVAFSVLVASLYGFMAALALLRTRIAIRIAARLQAGLDGDAALVRAFPVTAPVWKTRREPAGRAGKAPRLRGYGGAPDADQPC